MLARAGRWLPGAAIFIIIKILNWGREENTLFTGWTDETDLVPNPGTNELSSSQSYPAHRAGEADPATFAAMRNRRVLEGLLSFPI